MARRTRRARGSLAALECSAGDVTAYAQHGQQPNDGSRDHDDARQATCFCLKGAAGTVRASGDSSNGPGPGVARRPRGRPFPSDLLGRGAPLASAPPPPRRAPPAGCRLIAKHPGLRRPATCIAHSDHYRSMAESELLECAGADLTQETPAAQQVNPRLKVSSQRRRYTQWQKVHQPRLLRDRPQPLACHQGGVSAAAPSPSCDARRLLLPSPRLPRADADQLRPKRVTE